MNLSLTGCCEARALSSRLVQRLLLRKGEGHVQFLKVLCPGQGTLVYTLQEVKPTVFLGVPCVWEKMQENIKENVSRSSSLRKKAFTWAKILGLKTNTKRMLG